MGREVHGLLEASLKTMHLRRGLGGDIVKVVVLFPKVEDHGSQSLNVEVTVRYYYPNHEKTYRARVSYLYYEPRITYRGQTRSFKIGANKFAEKEIMDMLVAEEMGQ